MTSFLTWMNNRLTISSHPAIKPPEEKWWQNYNVVLNVSDYLDHNLYSEIITDGILSFWFPIGESFGMPLENIFGALSIMWEAEKIDNTVFMHCRAGRNRSVAVADCYYFIRTGNHRSDNSIDVAYGKNKANKMLLNIKDNQLPGIYRMEHFLEKCREMFKDPTVANDAYIDWLKKETFGY